MVTTPTSSINTPFKFSDMSKYAKLPAHTDQIVGNSDSIIENARQASSQLKAMAHESRLAILFHLYNGDKSVSQLEKLLDLRQPAVSQQLARLRSDHMVSTERRGKQIYYALASRHAFIIVELLHRLYGGKMDQ